MWRLQAFSVADALAIVPDDAIGGPTWHAATRQRIGPADERVVAISTMSDECRTRSTSGRRGGSNLP